MSRARTNFLLLLLLTLASSAMGQTHRGSVRGTVTDPNHAVIPGATVSLENNDTHLVRTTISNAEGEYAITSVPPGNYFLTVKAAGFERFPQRVELRVNQE
ncbi:MAG TPA: carboxypeptidase-like regulatory domain-containing protein, partial [Pyrinomonadaceae bacterium]